MEKVCAVSEVSEGRMKEFSVKDNKILIANVKGKFYAVQARCSHMGGTLAEGKLDGNCVTCPRHKAQFDVTSGQVVKDVGGVMKFLTLGGAKPLQKYKTSVKNGFVLVEV